MIQHKTLEKKAAWAEAMQQEDTVNKYLQQKKEELATLKQQE